MDRVLPKIIGSGRVSGTRQALLLEDLVKEFAGFFCIGLYELKDCSPVQYWLGWEAKEGF